MDLPARLLLLASFSVSAFAASPVIDDPVQANRVATSFPVGKTLIFPITALDPDGDPLEFKATSDNPRILVRAKTGNPALRLTVNYGAGLSGDMVFQLFRDWTPVTDGFISGFAQSGFFDNVKFHRVLKNFVIQGGDPLGTGQGGPGMTGNVPATAFKFDNEAFPGLIFSGRGQLAMANSDPPYKPGGGGDPKYDPSTGWPLGYDYGGTNGSQFFVTLGQPRFLDFKHTIFGQLLRGWETLDAIANVPVHSNNDPVNPEISVPDTAVVITSAKVEANNHDAVLILSATGAVSSATITVTATDGQGGTATKTFTVSSVTDLVNSPPVVLGVPPLTVAKETRLDFPLKSFDLEADFRFFNHRLIGASASNAASTESGAVAALRGDPGFEGQVRMGFDVSQFNIGVGQAELPIARTFAVIGIGDKAIRGEPVTVRSQPASGAVVARFTDLDRTGVPANFTAVINWGDGTPVQPGTVTRDATTHRANAYSVTGTHTYARPGIYTIVTTVTGDKGAQAKIRSQAVISEAPLRAAGLEIVNRGAVVTNRQLATFTDTTPARPADFTATIDWGDGASSAGRISKTADGSFRVRGSHTFKDAEAFAVSVRIHKVDTAASSDAFAWSTVTVTGFAPAPHLPPFPLAHLIGYWADGPAKGIANTIKDAFVPGDLRVQMTGTFGVLNSGTRASPPSKIRFWLSDDTKVDGVPADASLVVNGVPELTVGSIAGGGGGQGEFTIALPKGASGAGKYLLSELVYSDPIIDHSKVEKVVVTGPIDPAIIVFDQTGTQTTKAGGAVTFKVVLDTPPTSDVKIAVVSSKPTAGTVSTAQLTFTPVNWKDAQMVTVTGVDDHNQNIVPYQVSLQDVVSSDPLYDKLPGPVLNLVNTP